MSNGPSLLVRGGPFGVFPTLLAGRSSIGDHGVVILVGVMVGAGLISLIVLTGLGELRRGAGPPIVALAAIFFPITWVVWYAKDELPAHRHAHRVG